MFALDISENHIRILEVVKKRNQFLLHGMAEGPLADSNDLPAILQKLAKDATPKAIVTRELAFAIPEEETFIKVVSIPKDGSEAREAKLLENISGVLPYAPEEIYWDWRIVEEENDQSDHDDAVFVAATKKTVDRYINLITQGGFRPLLVETEVNALLWGALLNPLFAPTDIEPTILVDFGLTKTTMIIFARGAIRFTTSTKIVIGDNIHAPGVSQENTQNPQYIDDLANQIKERIDYYQEHLMHTHGGPPAPITQLLLTGAWSGTEDLSASFGKKLNLTIREQPKVLPLTPSYITALGLSMRAIYEET